jgi:hypothetical protein
MQSSSIGFGLCTLLDICGGDQQQVHKGHCHHFALP